MEFSGMLERFLAYIAVDTQSAEGSTAFPSTEKQFQLAEMLQRELQEIGLADARVTKNCYVLATLPGNSQLETPTIALIAHLDTSPDVPGGPVKALLHRHYDGKDIVLSEDLVIKTAENPLLLGKVGKTIITADGTTLLGADNKAGITEIMAALKYLVDHPEEPRPRIRVVFTPDEEIGRGTEKITVAEIDADYAYTVDGEKLGDIEDETFCADSLEVVIRGVNVHPGFAKGKMVNALKVAAALVTALPPDRLSPETTSGKEGYVHPHQVSGGVEACTLKFLLRDFSSAGLKEHADTIRTLLDQVLLNFPGAEAQVNLIESYRNMKEVLDNHPLVLEMALQAVRESGLDPNRQSIRGGTDGARLSFMGLPTPNIFTGGSNFHSRQEWIALEDMHKTAEVLVRLLKLWAKAEKKA